MSLVPKMGYSITASTLHWCTAVPFGGAIGTVMMAQQAPKEEKGKWMFRHKSLGLLTGMIVAPRLAYRLFNRQAYNVAELPGSAAWELMASKVTHYFLIGFMAVMPASGIAMGYYGGKGLPFFYTTIPGIVKTEDNKASTGNIAKNSFNIHKTLGTYGKFAVPIHAGAAFKHSLSGQAIFTRINPFRAARG